MIVDIVLWTRKHPKDYPYSSYLCVISKYIEKESCFLRTLEKLVRCSGCNVHLALPHDFSSSDPRFVSFECFSRSLLDEGKPNDQSGSS